MSRAAEIHRQKRQAKLENSIYGGAEEEIPTGHKSLPITLNSQFNLTGSLHYKIPKSKFFKNKNTSASVLVFPYLIRI